MKLEHDRRMIEAIEELKLAARRNGQISARMLNKVVKDFELNPQQLGMRFEMLVGKKVTEYIVKSSSRENQEKTAQYRARSKHEGRSAEYLNRYAGLHGAIANNGREWMVYIGSYEEEVGFVHEFVNQHLTIVVLEWTDLHNHFPGFVVRLFACA